MIRGMSWEDAVMEGQELVLATSSNEGDPRAIVVVSLGLVEGKLLIGACQMGASLKNIEYNGRASIVAKSGGEYFRINGKVEVHSEGKFFDLAFGKLEPPKPKRALVMTIEEVFDLDKVKRVL